MTDRRSRGARRSSNCFQTSSAFGFLFFMVRSRKEVDSRRSSVNSSQEKKGQRLNTENTEAGARRAQRRKKQIPLCARDDRFARLRRRRAHTRTRDDRDQRCRGSISQQRQSPGRGKCGAKRKRAKPRSSRRFTQKQLYHNDEVLQALISRISMGLGGTPIMRRLATPRASA